MTVVRKIKQLLFNYNLLIVCANTMRNNAISRMQLYYGQTGKKKQKRFLMAKIDFERYSIYLDELVNQKSELLKNLELVLDKHNKRYTKVFMLCYVEGKNKKEIADELGYSVEAVGRIINKINNELIKVYKK